MSAITTAQLKNLAASLAGTLHFDSLLRTLYATDASVYREFKDVNDFVSELKTLLSKQEQ